jgi:hypothetical protein
MDANDFSADAALFAELRRTWAEVDPVPADLVDRMVAAVAVTDLSREYEMLTLVEPLRVAVRSEEAETTTVQFSDGDTNVLLHVSATEGGGRRLDGWVDATTLAVMLVQGDTEVPAQQVTDGRFAFDAAVAGLSHLRLVVRDSTGAMREFHTPKFEI